MMQQHRAPIVHEHSSGQGSRTPEQVHNGLHIYMVKRKADVITLTEQYSKKFRDVVHAMAELHGYFVCQGPEPSDDCVILFKKSRFTVHPKHIWWDELSPLPQNRAKGGPIHHSITALAWDKINKKYGLWTVAHLTAGVEKLWSKETAYRVKLWFTVRRVWAKKTGMRRRKYRVRVAMIADWNIDLRKKKFQALLKSMHPRLTLTWRSWNHKGGTLGSRTPEGTLTNMLIIEGAQLEPNDSFGDHVPYRETLA